jgi:DNA-binding MarR family transcriptional regulator
MTTTETASEPAAVTAWRAVLELVGWGGRRPPRFPTVALELGLAAKQLGVICRLEPGSGTPMRILGESLFCDASYTTDLVDRLEERGLIVRRPSPDDRRVKLIALTADGEACRRRALELLHEPPAEFEALTDSEIERLGELLTKALAKPPAPVA